MPNLPGQHFLVPRHAAVPVPAAHMFASTAACPLLKQQQGGQELTQALQSIHQLWSNKRKDDGHMASWLGGDLHRVAALVLQTDLSFTLEC